MSETIVVVPGIGETTLEELGYKISPLFKTLRLRAKDYKVGEVYQCPHCPKQLLSPRSWGAHQVRHSPNFIPPPIWNKELTKETDVRVKRNAEHIQDSLIKWNKEHPDSWKGKKNGMYGKRRPDLGEYNKLTKSKEMKGNVYRLGVKTRKHNDFVREIAEKLKQEGKHVIIFDGFVPDGLIIDGVKVFALEVGSIFNLDKKYPNPDLDGLIRFRKIGSDEYDIEEWKRNGGGEHGEQ